MVSDQQTALQKTTNEALIMRIMRTMVITFPLNEQVASEPSMLTFRGKSRLLPVSVFASFVPREGASEEEVQQEIQDRLREQVLKQLGVGKVS